MALITRSITFPEELLAEIDELANKKYTNRSEMFRRIYLEWKKQNAKLAIFEKIFQQQGLTIGEEESPSV